MLTRRGGIQCGTVGGSLRSPRPISSLAIAQSKASSISRGESAASHPDGLKLLRWQSSQEMVYHHFINDLGGSVPIWL